MSPSFEVETNFAASLKVTWPQAPNWVRKGALVVKAFSPNTFNLAFIQRKDEVSRIRQVPRT